VLGRTADYRQKKGPFKKTEELMNVQGIGEKSFLKLKPQITVTAGPDMGRVYELTTEIVRLGRAPSNEVALTDSQVGELHASIVCREGRFAIHTSVPDGLEVDGKVGPATFAAIEAALAAL